MTKRTLSALETLFADNTDGDISAQDLKDFLESALGSRQVDTVTAAAPTLTTDNDIVLIDATSNNIVVALPTAVGNANKTFLLKRIDTTTNDVTIDPNGTQTIDGALIAQLFRFGQSLEIVSDNANWRITTPNIMARNIYEQTASVVLANSNVATTLLGTHVGSAKFKANTIKASASFRVKLEGFLGTLGASTPNLTFLLKLGATTIITSPAIVQAGGLSNVGVVLDLQFTFRTVGTTGTIIGQGHVDINGTMTPVVMTATVTIATDADEAMDITAQWSAADPANTLTVTNVSVDLVN